MFDFALGSRFWPVPSPSTLMYASYPSAADVENWLRSTTYWPTDANQILRAQSQAAIAAAGAADEWENLTGWLPFLAKEENSTRTFAVTDSSGWLDFQGGILSIDTVTAGGTPLVLGSQYTLTPNSAPDRGRPYTGAQLYPHFTTTSFWSPSGINVTGRWGYCMEIPGDVFQACLQRAAINTLRAIPNNQGMASISQDGFSKSLDIVGILSQKDIAQGGDKDFATIAARYARVVC